MHQTTHRHTSGLLALLLLCAALLAPRPAHAGDEEAIENIILFLVGSFALELAIPDLRLEFAPDKSAPAINLAFPLAIHLGRVPLGESLHVGLVTFGEFQFQARDEVSRGAAGLRIPIEFLMGGEFSSRQGPGIFFEGGGVFGEDGTGPMAGVGLSYAFMHMSIGLMLRGTLIDDEIRPEVGLDFQIAIPFGQNI